MAIFLGIDGGGTKTSCVIGDDISVLGSGAASGSNLVRIGEDQARSALRAAIREACAAANVTAMQITRTCVGIAGGARPEVASMVRQILGELVQGEIKVLGDMVIALQAAFGSGPGVIVIAGTGSIAYGRNAAGQTARAGGWGFAISDEGSGHWIGRAAVAAALRAQDEGGNPPLLERLMQRWGVNTREQLILAANASPPPDFAALLPLVLGAADGDDAVVRSVLRQAGAELAALAKIVIHRLFSDAKTIPLAMSGGVFGNSALVRQLFYNGVRSEYPQVTVNANIVDPVEGALALARKGTHS